MGMETTQIGTPPCSRPTLAGLEYPPLLPLHLSGHHPAASTDADPYAHGYAKAKSREELERMNCQEQLWFVFKNKVERSRRLKRKQKDEER